VSKGAAWPGIRLIVAKPSLGDAALARMSSRPVASDPTASATTACLPSLSFGRLALPAGGLAQTVPGGRINRYGGNLLKRAAAP